MLMVPFAGLSLQSLNLDWRNITAKQIGQAWRRLQDTVQFAEILPPIGSQQLSYARFLELLNARRVKRVILMSDATCALVEVGSMGFNFYVS